MFSTVLCVCYSRKKTFIVPNTLIYLTFLHQLKNCNKEMQKSKKNNNNNWV